jgi:hypothetical protein
LVPCLIAEVEISKDSQFTLVIALKLQTDAEIIKTMIIDSQTRLSNPILDFVNIECELFINSFTGSGSDFRNSIF